MIFSISSIRTRTQKLGEQGQAIAEFALLLPVVLAFLVGILEFGRAWHSYQTITHAAREGARLAVTPTSTEDEVRSTIEQALQDASLDVTKADITLGLRTGSGTPDTVQISYQYQFRFVGSAMKLLKRSAEEEGENPPGTVSLTSRFVMRNE